MPKKRRRLNGFGYSSGDRFVKLDFWLLRSAAWQQLSLGGRCLLVELMQRYNGQNNGQISMRPREAARLLAIGKNTATKLFHDLDNLGFIRVRQQGHFDWKVRHATEWELPPVPGVGVGDQEAPPASQPLDSESPETRANGGRRGRFGHLSRGGCHRRWRFPSDLECKVHPSDCDGGGCPGRRANGRRQHHPPYRRVLHRKAMIEPPASSCAPAQARGLRSTE